MSGNGSVSFLNNTGDTKGGAICANTINFTSGGKTIFSGNTISGSSGIGGAICLDGISGSTCTLSAQGGDIIFYGNSATDASAKGGAIGLKGNNGNCTLDANSGNIIFDGNTIKSTGTERNAIDLGNSTENHSFKAKEGYSIYFYDTVTGGGSTGEVGINETGYTGSVIFSGEKLTTETTKFSQPLKIKAGSLVLKDGVTVEAKQVTQTDANSTVVMDLGTTLKGTDSSAGTVSLPNLAINIASLGGGGVRAPAKIQTQANQQITINSLSLIDPDGNGYEYPVFGKNLDFTGVQAAITTSGTVTKPTTNNTTQTPHYGYQGNWTVSWAQGAGTQEQNATFTWEKTGYIANPERVCALVPNTLWGNFSDLRVIQNLMEVSVDGAECHRG
ncbi:chlamydia polymorphic membrane middle domain protein, partial [Chlamydia ibidis 10-1398/6]